MKRQPSTTQPPELAPSAKLASVRQLALAVQRVAGKFSVTAVSGWTKHPDWPWPRTGPWNAHDIEEMLRWRREHLKADPTDHSDAAGQDPEAAHPFWQRHEQHAPIAYREFDQTWSDDIDPKEHKVRHALAQPPELVCGFERNVLTGKVTMSPQQAKEYVARAVAYRGTVVRVCRYLPSWLVERGLSEAEVARRMRAAFYSWLAGTVYCSNLIGEASEGEGGRHSP